MAVCCFYWKGGYEKNFFSSGPQLCMLKNIMKHIIGKPFYLLVQELLIKFSSLRRKCCDPLNRHPEKARTRSLQIMSMDTYKRLVDPPKMLVPGEKLCCDCIINQLFEPLQKRAALTVVQMKLNR